LVPQFNLIENIVPAGQGIRCKKKYTELIPTKGGICWHWTANEKPGANADAHRKYWERAEYGAHYVVDDKKVIHCVPDTEVVWHAGPGTDYTDYIRRKYPRGANLSLVGVEMCVNSDGDWNRTYQNAVALGVYLCKKYSFDPFSNFERHYDCTRKDCPRMWTPYVPGGEQAWQKFLYDVGVLLVDQVFTDIQGHWAEKEVLDAEELGLLARPADGRFRPDDKITRAETIALIMRLYRLLKGDA